MAQVKNSKTEKMVTVKEGDIVFFAETSGTIYQIIGGALYIKFEGNGRTIQDDYNCWIA
jgi:co-chaperonin GroES (HSP10)